MRFYPVGKAGRVWLTVVWVLVSVMWLDIEMDHTHRRPWMGLIWVSLAAINLSNTWLNYWTVEGDAIVQHSILWSKRYDAENVRYAGPVRGTSMRRWLRKAIELQMAGFSNVRYVSVADRGAFLEAVHTVAPHAEVVL